MPVPNVIHLLLGFIVVLSLICIGLIFYIFKLNEISKSLGITLGKAKLKAKLVYLFFPECQIVPEDLNWADFFNYDWEATSASKLDLYYSYVLKALSSNPAREWQEHILFGYYAKGKEQIRKNIRLKQRQALYFKELIKYLNKKPHNTPYSSTKSPKNPPKPRFLAISGWRAILGLFEDEFNLNKVTKTYRKLAMINHPDRGGSAEAMVLLNKAMEEATKELSRRT